MTRMFGLAPRALLLAASALGAFAPEFALAKAKVTDCTPNTSQPQLVTPRATGESVSRTTGVISERITNTTSTNTTIQSGFVACPVDHFAQDGDAEPEAIFRLGQQRGRDWRTQPGRVGIWGATSGSRIDNDEAGGQYSGNIFNVVAGYDQRVTRDLVVGLATGYERVDVDTRFNNGTMLGRSLTVAPYAGYAINDWLGVDVALGVTTIGYDFSRTSGTIRGNTDATRLFGAANLTANRTYGDYRVQARLGYLHLTESQDGYVESNGTNNNNNSLDFAQASATLKGFWDIRAGWGVLSPNISARVNYDVVQSGRVLLTNGVFSTQDRTGMVFGLGLDAAVGDDLSFGIGIESTQFRSYLDVTTLLANIRMLF